MQRSVVGWQGGRGGCRAVGTDGREGGGFAVPWDGIGVWERGLQCRAVPWNGREGEGAARWGAGIVLSVCVQVGQSVCLSVSMCVCVCVREREREPVCLCISLPVYVRLQIHGLSSATLWEGNGRAAEW